MLASKSSPHNCNDHLVASKTKLFDAAVLGVFHVPAFHVPTPQPVAGSALCIHMFSAAPIKYFIFNVPPPPDTVLDAFDGASKVYELLSIFVI